ncbi:amidase [Ramlibacter sp. PS4R-6]|uniref:amidase n=1 Tax=Ramlibacter sp. PS4R-6 TaxID=3133438 RepID=UPI00309CE434
MTVEAAVTQSLARIRAMNGGLKAFTAIREEESALELVRRLKGPLAGKLVAVKDIFDTTDFPTAYGSPIYSGHQPSTEAAMVAVLREAGAIVAGKSVTTEFAYLQPSPTINPAAPGRTPGGSSSGSAAAVAAGLVPLAIGSQTGGSTIRPASYCGIAGFKPSFGVLPTAGMKCFSWSLDTVGLFARTVADVREFAQAVSGGRVAKLPRRPAGQWRIGVPRSYPWGDVSASGEKVLVLAAERLLAAGTQVVAVDLPGWVDDCFRAHDAVQGWEAARTLAHEFDKQREQLSPLLRDYLVEARKVSDAAYAKAQAAARQARLDAHGWIKDIDVLLTPSAPDEAPMGFGSTGASTFNRAWTLLATPCVSVPGAKGASGLPMGVQVIAAAGEDSLCLAAAEMLEPLLRAT